MSADDFKKIVRELVDRDPIELCRTGAVCFFCLAKCEFDTPKDQCDHNHWCLWNRAAQLVKEHDQ